ncbi:MAG: L-2-amino-thiazoline-4-carboxylic acid hydrolase [Thermodesulfobacteriota bacterium]
MDDKEREIVEKVRSAIKDRAIWFALLFRSFKEALTEEEVERLARKAIYEFGRLKALKDPNGLDPPHWVRRHVEKGSSLVFDSDVEEAEDSAVQRMKCCPLVEAWREMGCTEDEVRLFCDIAMEGDRGRADFHGLRMEIRERLANGGRFCDLRISVG